MVAWSKKVVKTCMSVYGRHWLIRRYPKSETIMNIQWLPRSQYLNAICVTFVKHVCDIKNINCTLQCSSEFLPGTLTQLDNNVHTSHKKQAILLLKISIAVVQHTYQVNGIKHSVRQLLRVNIFLLFNTFLEIITYIYFFFQFQKQTDTKVPLSVRWVIHDQLQQQ